MASVPTPPPVKGWKLSRTMLGEFNVDYDCPSCKSGLKSPVKHAGKIDHCPDCNVAFLIPAAITAEVKKVKLTEAKDKARKAGEKQQRSQQRAQQREAEKIKAREEMASERERIAIQAENERAAESPKHPQRLRSIGMSSILFGASIGFYFLFAYGTAAPDSNVLNIGLLNDRLCGLVTGSTLGIIGAVFLSAHYAVSTLVQCMEAQDNQQSDDS